MHRAGALLTVLALVAVQAPWIACLCECAPAWGTTLFGLHAHDCLEEHDDPSHDSDCQDDVGFRVPANTMPTALQHAPPALLGGLFLTPDALCLPVLLARMHTLAHGPPLIAAIPMAAAERRLL